MPNFWTKTKEKIYELFNGPRTKDLDFDKKLEELKLVNLSISKLQHFYNSFQQKVQYFNTINDELSEYLHNIYKNDDDIIYMNTIKKIIEVHQQCKKNYENLLENLKEIQQFGYFWDSQYLEVSNSIEKREQARITYDHYDQKLENLVKTRNDKLSKGEMESMKEIQYFEDVMIIN